MTFIFTENVQPYVFEAENKFGMKIAFQAQVNVS